MQEKKLPPQHQPTLRVLRVLEVVSKHKEGVSLSELARTTEIPKGTLFPIVQTLVLNHFLHASKDSQRYSIGIKSVEVGQRFFDHFDMLATVKNEIHSIVEGCSETCHLGILDGGDVFYLHKEDSNKAIRMYSSIGKRLPAYGTGLGKALLSGFSEAEVRALYPQGLQPITENTITDFSVLLSQLERVRLEGVAYEKEESSVQVQCVAVPLRKGGKIQAAISVSVPIFRATDTLLEEIRSLLFQAQTRIEIVLQSTDYDFTHMH